MFTEDMIEKYIDYFSDDKIEFLKWENSDDIEDGVIVIGYPDYDEGVTKFIDDFYKSDLIDEDYLDNLGKYIGEDLTSAEIIENADIDLLKSILTYYVRQERFCDGIWEKAIEKKVFLKILLKLKSLIRNSSFEAEEV